LTSDLDLHGHRQRLASIYRRLGMYTAQATFPEAVALVVGYDVGSEGHFLVGFQRWLGALSDRPELAFMSLVVRAAFGAQASIGALTPVQDRQATAQLFTMLDSYLAELETKTETS
jgi:hypothetical protein